MSKPKKKQHKRQRIHAPNEVSEVFIRITDTIDVQPLHEGASVIYRVFHNGALNVIQVQLFWDSLRELFEVLTAKDGSFATRDGKFSVTPLPEGVQLMFTTTEPIVVVLDDETSGLLRGVIEALLSESWQAVCQGAPPAADDD